MICCGFEPHFERVFNSAETGIEKPNPKAFQMVLDYIGEDSSAVMIGDSYEADIEGATSQGIPAILVRTENKWAYPHHCENLVGVLEIIDRVSQSAPKKE